MKLDSSHSAGAESPKFRENFISQSHGGSFGAKEYVEKKRIDKRIGRVREPEQIARWRAAGGEVYKHALINRLGRNMYVYVCFFWNNFENIVFQRNNLPLNFFDDTITQEFFTIANPDLKKSII